MRRVLITACLAVASLAAPFSASADPTTDTDVTFFGVGVKNQQDGTAGQGQVAVTGESGQQITVQPSCGLGGIQVCHQPDPCVETVDGETYEGYLYDVFADGVYSHQTCVTDAPGETGAPPQVTPGQVLNAFRRLSWPSSALVVQPVGGRTLVNFETNFYTANTDSSTRRIRLLGQRVTIEATPAEYTWHHGDGTTATTSSPGAAYPRLLVTHEYLRTGRLSPAVDTTYTGRYRLGGGPWITIPGTHTVPGAAVGLEVVEATPMLTGY